MVTASEPRGVGVTAREAEVLALVGEHLTNAEIGARLFITVRTVETHVSSLLRKLRVPDRRALARRAAPPAPVHPAGGPPAPLPAALTPFVGRVAERADLELAIKRHRQVTAVGPGGVGKTRLVLRVAAEVAADFADGVWFVDLVSVTDPAMVGAAVAAGLGIGEQPGRSAAEAVITVLADRQALLVLDNCEQVRDGVAAFLERLLTRCRRVTALTTSRARLLVPFEHVHPVPPLAVDGTDEPEAVALFLDRAEAAGRPVDPSQVEQVAAVCRRLGGIPLAIELAAARLPSLGLDGLAAGLSDQLRLLTGGSRGDGRHHSVRTMLDWSQALLAPADAALLRRVSVFAAPFLAEAAAALAGVTPDAARDGLARLSDQSLVGPLAADDGTRYRLLEPVRQYGVEQLAQAGELAVTHARHLTWCLGVAAALSPDTPGWRVRFDAVADDGRAALARAARQPDQRDPAYALARALARLTFARGLADEAQQRYEQAAALADDARATAVALRSAADVAGCRMLGDDAYRLHRAAAEAARRGGDRATAASELATAVTVVYRFSGMFDQLPSPAEAAGLLAEARRLADGSADPAVRAALALAECGVAGDAFGSDLGHASLTVPETVALAERAVALAERSGEPLVESAALDALTGAQCWAGRVFEPAATTRRRADLVTAIPVTPGSARELVDVLAMASETCLGVGDLAGARSWGTRLRDLPLLAERGHIATSRLLVADALAGHADDVLLGSERFHEAWARAGRPHAPGLGMVAAAVAMTHGLRGANTERERWLGVETELGGTADRRAGYGPVLDGIVLLHQDRPDAALPLLGQEPDQMGAWITWIWGHWYAALRAEASVLAGHPDAGDRVARADRHVRGNPVASALVDRAGALLDRDPDRLRRLAVIFDRLGAPYQAVRTRTLAAHWGHGDARPGPQART